MGASAAADRLRLGLIPGSVAVDTFLIGCTGGPLDAEVLLGRSPSPPPLANDVGGREPPNLGGALPCRGKNAGAGGLAAGCGG